jgi:acyl carrier protein
MLFSTLKKMSMMRSSFRFIKTSKFFFAASPSPSQKLPVLDGKPADKKGTQPTQETTIQPWVEVENRLTKLRSELVLSDQTKIDQYVLGVVKNYFRTTYKEGLTLESKLSDHGLDSLDSVELGMVLEDELGYIIEAETLPQFTKVKHFSNYIKQIEAYKKEFVLLPQERAHQEEETWDNWIPGGEKLKSKLRSYTKSGGQSGAPKKEKEKH